jgi:hypothetical protein
MKKGLILARLWISPRRYVDAQSNLMRGNSDVQKPKRNARSGRHVTPLSDAPAENGSRGQRFKRLGLALRKSVESLGEAAK